MDRETALQFLYQMMIVKHGNGPGIWSVQMMRDAMIILLRSKAGMEKYMSPTVLIQKQSSTLLFLNNG